MIKFKQYITEVIHGKTDFEDPSSSDHLIYRLTKHYTPKIVKDKAHHNSVYKYTDTSYKIVNKYLNHGKESTINHLKMERGMDNEDVLNKDIDEHISHIPHLDSVTTSHEAPHDFYVYSGIKHDPSEGKKHTEPFKAHIKQFTSSSINAEKTKLFSATQHLEHTKDKHFLKIHIPEGSKHGAFIAEVSSHPHEQEFLLKRNLKLKIHHEPEIHVVKTRHKNFYYDIIHKNHVWHATIEE